MCPVGHVDAKGIVTTVARTRVRQDRFVLYRNLGPNDGEKDDTSGIELLHAKDGGGQVSAFQLVSGSLTT